RASLLEMAKAIVDTRAEVAEIKPEPGAPGKAAADDMPPAPANSGILAAAERIQDVASTMRERGIDPQTWEQIEALAASILSASSLRDPGDHRAHKLSEVLEYLERRIAAMLAACGEGEQASSQAMPAAQAAPDAGAITPAATNAAEGETVQDAPQPASPIDATHEVLLDDEADLFEASTQSAPGMPEPTRQFEPDPATPATPEPDAAAAAIASDPSLHSVRASERLDAEETRRLVGAQLDVDLLVVVPFEPRPTTEPPKQLEHAPIPITPLFEEPHAQAPIAAVTLPSAGTVAEPPPSEIRPTVGAEPQHGFEPPEVAVLFLMENAAA